jgi:hypothetical protein
MNYSDFINAAAVLQEKGFTPDYISFPLNYRALDRRINKWRRCAVLTRPTSRAAKGAPRNCLVLFAGDSEPVVRPWRGIRRQA